MICDLGAGHIAVSSHCARPCELDPHAFRQVAALLEAEITPPSLPDQLPPLLLSHDFSPTRADAGKCPYLRKASLCVQKLNRSALSWALDVPSSPSRRKPARLRRDSTFTASSASESDDHCQRDRKHGERCKRVVRGLPPSPLALALAAGWRPRRGDATHARWLAHDCDRSTPRHRPSRKSSCLYASGGLSDDTRNGACSPSARAIRPPTDSRPRGRVAQPLPAGQDPPSAPGGGRRLC